MTIRDLLIAARARIADERHWTQNAYAVDANGDPCAVLSVHANRWCATGALMRESGVDDEDDGASAESVNNARVQLEVLGGHSLSYLNDTFDHTEILRLFDEVIDAQAEAGA